MDTKKKNFDTAVEVKKRYEAANFMIDLIENEIREILSSEQFKDLPRDQQEMVVVGRARAVRFWRVHVGDYMDANIASWINVAAGSKTGSMKITLEEAVKIHGGNLEDVTPAEPEPVEEEEEEESSKKPSGDDILATLMADE